MVTEATRIAIAHDAQLERIVRALVDAVHPARIILFGSRARGDARPNSDYDLAVELDFGDYLECRRTLNAAVRAVVPTSDDVDVLPRHIGELERRGDDPGYLDWDIVREGVIVYPVGANSQALRPRWSPWAVREQPPYKSIAEWLSRAAEDFKDIRANLAAGEVGSMSGICFHAQQAAEKYVKVLYIERHTHPPRTHSLRELIDGLRAQGVGIPEFSRECDLLKDYAVDVRYPEHVPIPNRAHAHEVLASAEAIIAEVERLRRGGET